MTNKNDTKQVSYNEVQKTVNNITGEVIEEKTRKVIRVPKTPEFVMIFSNTVGILENLNRTESSVLFGLLTNKLINRGNLVSVDTNAKKFLSKKLNLKYETVHKAIKGMQEKNVIFRDEDNLMRLNPELFGKGEWDDIYKLRMEYSFDFDFDNKEMIQTRKVASYDRSFKEIEQKPHQITNASEVIDGNKTTQEIEVEEIHPNQSSFDFQEDKKVSAIEKLSNIDEDKLDKLLKILEEV